MEKPLHVRVAEALGCSPRGPKKDRLYGELWFCGCPVEYGKTPASPHGLPSTCCDVEPSEIPHYESDWDATGPLIERFGFQVYQPPESGWPWRATKYGVGTLPAGNGGSPLSAVCNLILALHEAGHLNAGPAASSSTSEDSTSTIGSSSSSEPM